MPRAYLTLATKKARSCCVRGDATFRPSFSDSPTVKYSFRKTGQTRERRCSARGGNLARLMEGKSCGRRAVRRTGIPCGACRGVRRFRVEKTPCKNPTPCKQPAATTGFQRICNPPAKRRNVQRNLISPKTLKLRRNYTGVFGAVHLQFPGLGQMRRKDRISEDFPIEGIEIQIRHIRRNCGKCSAGKGKFYREEDVPHRAVFLGKAILNTPHTSLLRTKYIYSHCIAKFRRTTVYGVKTDPQKCQGATANYASSRIKPDDAKTAHFCLWQIHI